MSLDADKVNHADYVNRLVRARARARVPTMPTGWSGLASPHLTLPLPYPTPNSTLRLLRPGGLLIMFGMLLFPTVEDQQALEA